MDRLSKALCREVASAREVPKTNVLTATNEMERASTTAHHAAPPLGEISTARRSRTLQVGEQSVSAFAAGREQRLVTLQIFCAQRR